MSAFELLLVIYGAVLAVAALGVVYRMIVGPTILDRAISSDSLVTLVIMGMALYVADSQAAWAGPAMLSLTGMAFIGTVTFARFVAREEPLQTRRSSHPVEPRTDTGPHEAIHPDPSDGDSWDDEPRNSVLFEEEHDLLDKEDPLSDPAHPGEPMENEDEDSFGAQPGWRGFEDEPRPPQDDGWTEEER
ncbi:MAG: monovalent cation/H+ antiporter complex subunit F [Brachybacterium sp.]